MSTCDFVPLEPYSIIAFSPESIPIFICNSGKSYCLKMAFIPCSTTINICNAHRSALLLDTFKSTAVVTGKYTTMASRHTSIYSRGYLQHQQSFLREYL